MAQDVLIRANDRGLYDLQIENSDFASAEGFESSIPTSLFSDARASAVQVQEAQKRRGWIGNILYAEIDRELGGLLWTLEQARLTQDTLNFARSYAEDSLQWMIDDGIARSISVTVERSDTRKVMVYIDILTIANTVQRYITLWRSTDINRIL